MKLKEWWKKQKLWVKGGVIGFMTGLILNFISMSDIWTEVSFFEEIIFYPFLFSENLFRFVWGICSGMECIFYIWVGGIIIYTLIGLIIGLMISLFKKNKIKR